MTPLAPDTVMAQIAMALPEGCRPNIIIIGSLAVGYHFFSGDSQRQVPTAPEPPWAGRWQDLLGRRLGCGAVDPEVLEP
jgi:hypothetical protein